MPQALQAKKNVLVVAKGGSFLEWNEKQDKGVFPFWREKNAGIQIAGSESVAKKCGEMYEPRAYCLPRDLSLYELILIFRKPTFDALCEC